MCSHGGTEGLTDSGCSFSPQQPNQICERVSQGSERDRPLFDATKLVVLPQKEPELSGQGEDSRFTGTVKGFVSETKNTATFCMFSFSAGTLRMMRMLQHPAAEPFQCLGGIYRLLELGFASVFLHFI